MSKNKKRPKNQQVFQQNLAEEVEFIINANKQYDDGHFEFMKQAAVSVRVLLHNTQSSTSLLSLLETKSAKTLLPSFADSSLTQGQYIMEDVGNVAPKELRLQDAALQQIYYPHINLSNGVHWIKLTDWLTEPIFFHDRHKYTRKAVILALSNNAGGAHVDPHYETDHMRKLLQNENSIVNHYAEWPDRLAEDEFVPGIKYLAHAHMRIITLEVLLMLNHEYHLPADNKIFLPPNPTWAAVRPNYSTHWRLNGAHYSEMR